jgi:hypothetical protein
MSSSKFESMKAVANKVLAEQAIKNNQSILAESEPWETSQTKEKVIKAMEASSKLMEETYRSLSAVYEMLPDSSPVDSKLKQIRDEVLKLKYELKQAQSRMHEHEMDESSIRTLTIHDPNVIASLNSTRGTAWHPEDKVALVKGDKVYVTGRDEHDVENKYKPLERYMTDRDNLELVHIVFTPEAQKIGLPKRRIK